MNSVQTIASALPFIALANEAGRRLTPAAKHCFRRSLATPKRFVRRVKS